MWSITSGVWVDELERVAPIEQPLSCTLPGAHHLTVGALPAWLSVTLSGATALARIAHPDQLFARTIRYRYRSQLHATTTIPQVPVGAIIYAVDQPDSVVVQATVVLTAFVTDPETQTVVSAGSTSFLVQVRADLVSLRQQLQLRLSQEQV